MHKPKKFKVDCFKGKSFAKLEVNDMRLVAYKNPVGDKWEIEVYHDGKLVQVLKYINTAYLKDYYNAYLTVARTKPKVVMA